MTRSISFITIGVRDLGPMRDVYRGWGWSELDGANNTFAAFDGNGVRLAFCPIDLLGGEAAPSEAAPTGTWNGVTLAMNVSSCAEVDDEVRQAIGAGARLVADPDEREWGGYSGYVADPEGTRWEIAFAPPADGAARGASDGDRMD